jgi:ribokinase
VRVAVVGSYGVGMTMRVPRVPVPGETVLGGQYSSGHGGKGSNQAVAARRLGADVVLLTAVGDDGMGTSARELWAAEGVEASVAVTAPAATMVGMILVDASGENRIVIATGALDHLRPEHVQGFGAELAAADIAVVSLEIPVETAVAALEVAHHAGTRTLLNPAPAHRLPERAWSCIDVLTPNRSEAAILLGLSPDAEEPPEQLAQALHARSGGTVVLTLGGGGAVICDDQGTERVAATAPVAVVDTTGAGDGFTAALAVELAAGRPVRDAVAFAGRVGAHVVAHHEVIPALPHRADLDEPEPV